MSTEKKIEKPLTEKELSNIEVNLEKVYSHDGFSATSMVIADLRTVIAELKRLRAGQAREKILRDELKKAERWFQYNSGELSDYSLSDKEDMQKKYEEVSMAIRKADAVEDGPSETNKTWIRSIRKTLNSGHYSRVSDELGPIIADLIICLEDEWGIE